MINWIEIRDKYFNVLDLSIQLLNNSIYMARNDELTIKFDISNNRDYHIYFNNLFQDMMKGNKMKSEYSFTITTPEFRVHNAFITNISENFSISGNIMNVSFHYDYIDSDEGIVERRDRIIDYILNGN